MLWFMNGKLIEGRPLMMKTRASNCEQICSHWTVDVNIMRGDVLVNEIESDASNGTHLVNRITTENQTMSQQSAAIQSNWKLK